MPCLYYKQANLVLLYHYIPNYKKILMKFLVLRFQLQEGECFQRGMKALVIGITQRKGDQQFIICKAEDLFLKSWEAGHRHWETSVTNKRAKGCTPADQHTLHQSLLSCL